MKATSRWRMRPLEKVNLVGFEKEKIKDKSPIDVFSPKAKYSCPPPHTAKNTHKQVDCSQRKLYAYPNLDKLSISVPSMATDGKIQCINGQNKYDTGDKLVIKISGRHPIAAFSTNPSSNSQRHKLSDVPRSIDNKITSILFQDDDNQCHLQHEDSYRADKIMPFEHDKFRSHYPSQKYCSRNVAAFRFKPVYCCGYMPEVSPPSTIFNNQLHYFNKHS